MGRHIGRRPPSWCARRTAISGEIARDACWGRELRDALGCACLLFAALVALDWGTGNLSFPRVGLWAGLGVLLFVVLLPPLVTGGERWLASRGVLRMREVRTDCLVSVRLYDGVAARLVLRDVHGERVQLDPRVLTSNPLIWHLLEQGAHRSYESGNLLCGMTALERLGKRIDGETCRAILRASGLS